MQTGRVIPLYPQREFQTRTSPRPLRRAIRAFRTAAAIVDLTVTAAIGVGVLVCFGLVFTML